MRRQIKMLGALLVSVLIAGMLPQKAHAEESRTFSELQNAIDGASYVKLEKNYEYDDGFSANGIDIKDSITIDLNGHTIDGNGKARIFFVNSGVKLTLKGPGTITGGMAAEGGGIYADVNAKLSLQDVEISGNAAMEHGGGVFLHSGAKGLEIGGETIVSDNTGQIPGVGIAADNVYLHAFQLTVTSKLTGKAKIGLSPDPGEIRSYSGNENFKGMMPLGTGFNTHHPGADIEDFFVSDDPNICIGNRALNGYDMFCSEHTHEMECRTNRDNEAELLYVCTKESCPMPSPFAKLTLVADNRPYNGKKYDDARLVDLEQFNRITGSNLVLSGENGTYLYYQKGEDTDFRWDPLAPGSYWAVFDGNGESSQKIKTQFQITRAPLTVKPKTQTYTYNGELQGPGDLTYTGPAAAAAVEAAGLADGDRVTSVTIDGQGREIGTYELEITGLRIERIENSEEIDVTDCYDITYEKGSLVIGKEPLTLVLTMDDWIVGEAASIPVLTGNEGNGDVTYAYKPKGADEKAYSPDVPTAAGEYTVRATVAETEYYQGGEQTADFIIRSTSTTAIIRYDLNGGTMDGKTGTVTAEAETGTTITLPAPTREGYSFVNWGDPAWTARAGFLVEGDHTFTAQWQENGQHTHRLTLVEAAEAGCTQAGNSAYYTCDSCDLWFEDAAGAVEITDKKSVIIPALGHSWSPWKQTKAPTALKKGEETRVCTRCGEEETRSIPARGFDDDDDDDSGSRTGARGTALESGSWSQTADGWTYQLSAGGLATGWHYIYSGGRSDWYFFDSRGIMQTGWLDFEGSRYYLNPVSNGYMGAMQTGWQLIEGRWYYFETVAGQNLGHMYVNRVTPDGYRTGSDGAWDGAPAAGR